MRLRWVPALLGLIAPVLVLAAELGTRGEESSLSGGHRGPRVIISQAEVRWRSPP